jgi:hypothetical protein
MGEHDTIDTSEIPEAGEEWFARARLRTQFGPIRF